MMLLIYFIFFLLLQGLDMWSTYRIITKGGTELNPVLRTIMNKLGLICGLSVVKVVISAVLGGLCLLLPTIMIYFMPVACLVYIVVAGHNINELVKQK